MFGISSASKEAINKVVEDIFDRIALQFIGDIPKLKYKKLLLISHEPHFGLANLFIQAMANKAPNPIEADALKSLLESSHGYIEALKNRTRSNITERIDGAVKEAQLRKEKVTEETVQALMAEELNKAKAHLRAITESESTKLRNVGALMDISRVSSSIGDPDPNVFFVVVKDGKTCNECLKIHLEPNQVTPRVWKLSELKQSYHKRGEEFPSAFGLHPHCFTENTKIHTTNGLENIKNLFETQSNVEVFVDARIKNRKIGNNQYGKSIEGSVWLDRHAKGTNKFEATKVYDTGIQNCLKITLSNGFSISVSEGHEMWVDDDKNGKKIRANHVQIGDKIPLISGECGFGMDHFPELAELMGNLMGDGHIGDKTAQWNFFGNDIPYGEKLYSLAKQFKHKCNNYKEQLTIFPPNEKYNVGRATFNSVNLKNIFKEEFLLSKTPRRVPPRLWKADKETISAFLRGLYAADGHSEKNPSVVLCQNDLEFLNEIQLLLSNFGLIANIYKHGEETEKIITYANGECFDTKRKTAWRLILGGWEQCSIFAKDIGMGVLSKQEKLRIFLSETEGKNMNGSWRTSKVISIENLGLKQTYCLTEPMTNTVTANGIVTGQCRCTLTFLSKGFGFDSAGRVKYIGSDYNAYVAQSALEKI